MAFMVQLSNHFPGLLYKKIVLYTFLDILTALSSHSDEVYDSMSHPVTLFTSREQLMMDPNSLTRSKIQSNLVTLLTSMFLKAVVIAQSELNQVFSTYEADVTLQSSPQ